MPAMTAVGGPMLVTTLVGVLILFTLVAVYFFFKNRELQHRLKLELRDVHGSNSGERQTYRRVADAGGFS